MINEGSIRGKQGPSIAGKSGEDVDRLSNDVAVRSQRDVVPWIVFLFMEFT
jgi:hypothetical protein